MLVLTKAIGILLTPPGVIVALVVLGLLLQLRWRFFGSVVAWVGALLLLVLSLPVTGFYLLDTLEDRIPPLTPADAAMLHHRAAAIVILGGGRNSGAPEYGGDTVSELTLERLRYGARLHRANQLPLLVTGGAPLGEAAAEATLMQEALTNDFRVDVRWAEARSRTTRENAIYARAILEADGIRRIALVTHAWHMPRAIRAFEQAGLEVVPAPLAFTGNRARAHTLAYLPTISGLSMSSRAIHEWIGMFWYRLAYRETPAPTGPARSRQSADRSD